jgi:hypothetical protein
MVGRVSVANRNVHCKQTRAWSDAPCRQKSVSIGVNPWLKLLREFGLGKIVRGGVG